MLAHQARRAVRLFPGYALVERDLFIASRKSSRDSPSSLRLSLVKARSTAAAIFALGCARPRQQMPRLARIHGALFWGCRCVRFPPRYCEPASEWTVAVEHHLEDRKTARSAWGPVDLDPVWMVSTASPANRSLRATRLYVVRTTPPARARTRAARECSGKSWVHELLTLISTRARRTIPNCRRGDPGRARLRPTIYSAA